MPPKDSPPRARPSRPTQRPSTTSTAQARPTDAPSTERTAWTCASYTSAQSTAAGPSQLSTSSLASRERSPSDRGGRSDMRVDPVAVPPLTTNLRQSTRASGIDLADLESQEHARRTRERSAGQQGQVDTLEQQLRTVQLRTRTRAPKRRMEPREDTKSFIHRVLMSSTDRRERIARFQTEIVSLLEHREGDDMYLRAVGLLETAIEVQQGKITEEEERDARRQGIAGHSTG